jgi:hypothetical protein
MAKSKMSPAVIKQERQWEIEDALRTLQRADKIRNDSKLMLDVKKSIDNLQKMAFGGGASKSMGGSKKSMGTSKKK